MSKIVIIKVTYNLIKHELILFLSQHTLLEYIKEINICRSLFVYTLL